MNNTHYRRRQTLHRFADERWITIGKKSEDSKGRPVKIDGEGNIVGGAVPKSWQGKSIRDAWKKTDEKASKDLDAETSGGYTPDVGNGADKTGGEAMSESVDIDAHYNKDRKRIIVIVGGNEVQSSDLWRLGESWYRKELTGSEEGADALKEAIETAKEDMHKTADALKKSSPRVLHGNTYKVRDTLKSLGAKYDPKTKKWSITPDKYTQAMEAIRSGKNKKPLAKNSQAELVKLSDQELAFKGLIRIDDQKYGPYVRKATDEELYDVLP